MHAYSTIPPPLLTHTSSIRILGMTQFSAFLFALLDLIYILFELGRCMLNVRKHTNVILGYVLYPTIVAPNALVAGGPYTRYGLS